MLWFFLIVFLHLNLLFSHICSIEYFIAIYFCYLVWRQNALPIMARSLYSFVIHLTTIFRFCTSMLCCWGFSSSSIRVFQLWHKLELFKLQHNRLIDHWSLDDYYLTTHIFSKLKTSTHLLVGHKSSNCNILYKHNFLLHTLEWTKSMTIRSTKSIAYVFDGPWLLDNFFDANFSTLCFVIFV